MGANNGILNVLICRSQNTLSVPASPSPYISRLHKMDFNEIRDLLLCFMYVLHNLPDGETCLTFSLISVFGLEALLSFIPCIYIYMHMCVCDFTFKKIILVFVVDFKLYFLKFNVCL